MKEYFIRFSREGQEDLTLRKLLRVSDANRLIKTIGSTVAGITLVECWEIK